MNFTNNSSGDQGPDQDTSPVFYGPQPPIAPIPPPLPDSIGQFDITDQRQIPSQFFPPYAYLLDDNQQDQVFRYCQSQLAPFLPQYVASEPTPMQTWSTEPTYPRQNFTSYNENAPIPSAQRFGVRDMPAWSMPNYQARGVPPWQLSSTNTQGESSFPFDYSQNGMQQQQQQQQEQEPAQHSTSYPLDEDISGIQNDSLPVKHDEDAYPTNTAFNQPRVQSKYFTNVPGYRPTLKRHPGFARTNGSSLISKRNRSGPGLADPSSNPTELAPRIKTRRLRNTPRKRIRTNTPKKSRGPNSDYTQITGRILLWLRGWWNNVPDPWTRKQLAWAVIGQSKIHRGVDTAENLISRNETEALKRYLNRFVGEKGVLEWLNQREKARKNRSWDRIGALCYFARWAPPGFPLSLEDVTGEEMWPGPPADLYQPADPPIPILDRDPDYRCNIAEEIRAELISPSDDDGANHHEYDYIEIESDSEHDSYLCMQDDTSPGSSH